MDQVPTRPPDSDSVFFVGLLVFMLCPALAGNPAISTTKEWLVSLFSLSISAMI